LFWRFFKFYFNLIGEIVDSTGKIVIIEKNLMEYPNLVISNITGNCTFNFTVEGKARYPEKQISLDNTEIVIRFTEPGEPEAKG